MIPRVIWGAPQWIWGAIALWLFATLVVLFSYRRSNASLRIKILGATLKGLGFSALVISLIEPLFTGSRPRRGANSFAILADNSQSLLIRDDNSSVTRGDWIRNTVASDTEWKTRLAQDFDVRNYVFDAQLRGVENFNQLSFDGTRSNLSTSIASLSRRFRGLPLAGVLLFTDGNKTDLNDMDWSQMPPVYPVLPPSSHEIRDIGVRNVSISQANFESAPVVVRAEVSSTGFQGETIVTTLADEQGKIIERQTKTTTSKDETNDFRFQFRPDHKGVHFYRVSSTALSDESQEGAVSSAREQTLANNSRLIVVEQGRGPYRVLYVTGRPNWEFKFLRRAVSEDEQLQLVGLIRIAKRQPKFDFRNPRAGSNSPLFDGFDHPDHELAERRDEPVLVRLGTVDEAELRDGFPKTAEELYRYHAIILDDLESAFFSQDQLALLRNFVSRRGGGLLMLGGPDSFTEGKYDRTPVGDMLPIYMNRSKPVDSDSEYHLILTREGWLQPWVRLRKTEEDERQRLTAMTPFQTVSSVGDIKPGAAVLSQVRDSSGNSTPALIAQQFGKGHVAALLVGDLWRWGMKRNDGSEDDFDKSWRQTIRWLVGDVPNQIDLTHQPNAESATGSTGIVVRVRDEEFRPLDNAKVSVTVTLPNAKSLKMDAAPHDKEAGAYVATFVTKEPGAYRILATAEAPNGSVIGSEETGLAAQPAAEEFARLQPDNDFLELIATKTKGELIEGDRLNQFVRSLSTRSAPINEPWTSPLWHNPLYFLVAIACLSCEWGLRRYNGMA